MNARKFIRLALTAAVVRNKFDKLKSILVVYFLHRPRFGAERTSREAIEFYFFYDRIFKIIADTRNFCGKYKNVKDSVCKMSCK